MIHVQSFHTETEIRIREHVLPLHFESRETSTIPTSTQELQPLAVDSEDYPFQLDMFVGSRETSSTTTSSEELQLLAVNSDKHSLQSDNLSNLDKVPRSLRQRRIFNCSTPTGTIIHSNLITFLCPTHRIVLAKLTSKRASFRRTFPLFVFAGCGERQINR